MAWRRIGIRKIDITKEKDVPHTGTFIKSEEVDGKFGKQLHHHFTDDEGSEYAVYGFTVLNNAMAEVVAGDYCRLIYRGVKKDTKTKYGIKDIHICDVDVEDPDEKGKKKEK